MSRHHLYFARLFRLFAGLPDRWKPYATAAGACLLLILTCILIALVNDPPWPAHFAFLASMA